MSQYPYRNIKYYPQYAVFELSLRCNMRCKHCGSRAGAPRVNELTIPECLDIAAQLIEMGLERITLIGGEILLLPDWDQVARKFVAHNVVTSIITNGYQLDAQAAQQIKDTGINSVAISLDGFQHTHNQIRGRADAFAKVTQAFTHLQAANVPFSAVTTVLASNINELELIHDYLVAQGAFAWQLQLASPMGNAADDRSALISPQQIAPLIAFIKAKQRLGQIRICIGDNLRFKENCAIEDSYHSSGGCSQWFGCMAGLLVVGIDSIGNVRGCESLCDDKFIEGNLRNESLAQIWHKKGAFAYNRDYQPELLQGKCSACDKAAWCGGGCRQLSYFTTGCCHASLYCNYPDISNQA